MAAERKSRTRTVAELIAAESRRIDGEIGSDAEGRIPPLMSDQGRTANVDDAVDYLVILLRGDLPHLDEEWIKKLITMIGDRDIDHESTRRIWAAFDFAAMRYGHRVRKLRQQFEKARRTAKD